MDTIMIFEIVNLVGRRPLNLCFQIQKIWQSSERFSFSLVNFHFFPGKSECCFKDFCVLLRRNMILCNRFLSLQSLLFPEIVKFGLPVKAHPKVALITGGILHYGVRRGCAPVLGSFWLEILALEYTFTGKFL